MWLLPDEQKTGGTESGRGGEERAGQGRPRLPWAPTLAGVRGPQLLPEPGPQGCSLLSGGQEVAGGERGEGGEAGMRQCGDGQGRPGREGLRPPQLLGWAGGARPVAAEQLRNLFS